MDEDIITSGSPAINPIPPIPGLPLILDGNFFRVISEDGLKVTGQCTLCPSRIMGLKTTTSNFNTHLKKMHPERHKLYEEYKIERGQSIKKRRTSMEPSSVSGTTQFSPTSIKRRVSNNNGFPNPPSLNGIGGSPVAGSSQSISSSPQGFQRRIQSTSSSSSGASFTKRPPQQMLGTISTTSLLPNARANARRKETDNIVFNFIVKSLSPTALVENRHFISMISSLSANPRRVISKNALENRISAQCMDRRGMIVNRLSKAEYICMTADAWSTINDTSTTFIAITAHWIGNDLKMESVLLCCRRFQDDLTYSKFVEVFYETIELFQIAIDRVSCLVTNNGSNLISTRVYKVREDDEEDKYLDHVVTNEELSFYAINALISDSKNQKPEEEIFFPSHYDCPTQTLVGVLATAIFETLSNPEYEASYLFQSSIFKCQSIWTMCSNRERANFVKETYGLEVLIPNKQSWCSYHDALSSIVSNKEVLDEICGSFSLEEFSDTEIEFLDEYIRLMEPVTDTLNALQDPSDLCMGSFVPTILTLKSRMDEILEYDDFKYTKSCASMFTTGLCGPFSDIITLDTKARPLILAAMLHPQYKQTWIPEEKLETLRSWYLEEVNSFGPLEDNAANGSVTLDEEFLAYLDAPCGPVCEEQFIEFPNVRKLFLTFNTAIASQIPVERVMNFVEVSCAPVRLVLSDDVFENMVMLKFN